MLKRSGKLFADETVAPVLDPGRGRTKRGQLWAYARDNRRPAMGRQRPARGRLPLRARPKGRAAYRASACRRDRPLAIATTTLSRRSDDNAHHLFQAPAPAGFMDQKTVATGIRL